MMNITILQNCHDQYGRELNPHAMRVRTEKAIALIKNITPSDIIKLGLSTEPKNQKE